MSKSITNNFQHTTELLQAALPYTKGRQRSNIEILLKAGELFDSISNNQSPTVSSCSLQNEQIDLEGLCLSLQAVGTPKEQDMINNILNFLQTQRLYETYKNMRGILPAGESGNFTRTQLLPMIEHFFQNYMTNNKGGQKL